MNDFAFDMLKIILCIILASAIGIERRRWGKPVGMRTLSLVCAGSALVTIVSLDSFPQEGAKVLAGIVTGVGFLGAGAIIAQEDKITGLTTAATIWAVAIMGIGIGIGRIWLSTIFAILVFLLLETGRVEQKITKSLKKKKAS